MAKPSVAEKHHSTKWQQSGIKFSSVGSKGKYANYMWNSACSWVVLDHPIDFQWLQQLILGILKSFLWTRHVQCVSDSSFYSLMLHFQNAHLFRERWKLCNIFLYVWSTGIVHMYNFVIILLTKWYLPVYYTDMQCM